MPIDSETNAAAGVDDIDNGAFDFDLTCPSCNADLTNDPEFESIRVCSSCRRHFWMMARERVSQLADKSSFVETNAELISVDPLVFHDRLPVADRLAEEREQLEVSEAVVTGQASVGGEAVVIIALDLAVVGSGIGILTGEKIALGMELALTRRIPLLAICSGGAGRGQEGVLSLVQLPKLASMATRLHRTGVPFIAILTHPTAGSVALGLANQADFIFAEPGARLRAGSAMEEHEPAGSPDEMLQSGAIDAIVDRAELRNLVRSILDLTAQRGGLVTSAIVQPAPNNSGRTWDELALAGHHSRPSALDYLNRLTPQSVELHGDRISADSSALVTSLGRLDGLTTAFMVIDGGQMADASAFRKASRFLRLVAHLEIPVVTLVGSPETEKDPSWQTMVAMSQMLALIAALPVPIVSAVLAEARGAGAYLFTLGDRILMQAHAVLTMPGTDSIATSRDCARLGVVDTVVAEPDGGSHRNPEEATAQLRQALRHALAEVGGAGQRRLIEDRARRFRQYGLATADSREEARREVHELQEFQRIVARSIDDLKQRWDQRQLSLPNFSPRPFGTHPGSRPNLSSLTLPKITFKRPDLSEFASRVGANRRIPASKSTMPPIAGEEKAS